MHICTYYTWSLALRVRLKWNFFLSHYFLSSLKYADQYLLLQFCSRMPVSFLQALWNFIYLKYIIVFRLIRMCIPHGVVVYIPGFELKSPGFDPRRGHSHFRKFFFSFFRHFFFQSACRKLTGILEQNCKSKHWSEYFKDDLGLWL